MSIAGKIVVTLRPGGAAAIRSSRPLQLTMGLRGLAAAEVVARVPALYALCGNAQGRAAQLALQAAGEAPGDHPGYSDRDCIAEAALEYLWRFAIDLPQWAGLAPVLAPFAQLRRQLPQEASAQAAALLSAYVAETLLGMPLDKWCAQPAPALLAWLATSEAAAAELLRRAAALPAATGFAEPVQLARFSDAELRALATAMGDDAFLAAPRWQGRFAETGALAYQQAHPWFRAPAVAAVSPAVKRLLARLLELGALVALIGEEPAAPPISGGLRLGAGRGLGWVRTARGLLVHRADTAGARVVDYRILAPTEWNFHPQGVLAEQLTGWSRIDGDSRERWLALQVLSLDPCVAYELEVYDA